MVRVRMFAGPDQRRRQGRSFLHLLERAHQGRPVWPGLRAGRLPFRLCVSVFGTAGDLITRVGRYGNADDSTGPDVHFTWPAYVDVVGDKFYVVDSNANRVAVVRTQYAAEGTSDL